MDVVAVPPLAVNAGTHTPHRVDVVVVPPLAASRLSGVRVDVVVVPPLAVNAGTHTPPPLVFQESGWMLLLFHHLLLMQAHTHHRLSSFRNQGCGQSETR